MRYQKTKRVQKSFFRGWPLAVASVTVILVALAIFLYANQDDEPKGSTATTANSETKGEPPTEKPVDTSNPSNPSQTPSTNDKDQAPSTAVATNLKEPSDSTFVSNHNPKLSAGLALDSVCNTSPGATCKIIFTKDGVSKSLPDKIADSGGSAYWTWTLSDVGLTAGTWKVTATATLGTQTKTAADAQALEVSP